MSGDFDAILRDAAAALGGMPGVAAIKDHPVLADMAAVVALSHCRIELAHAPNSAKPIPLAKPDVSHTAAGRALLSAAAALTAIRFHGGNDVPTIKGELGLDRAAAVTAAMLANGATGEDAMELFETVGRALSEIETKIDAECGNFVSFILKRDLGLTGRIGTHRVNAVCNWALCHHLDGHEGRDDAILRRLQALGAYGAIYSILMTPDITRAIDEGRELAPLLIAHLGIDRERLSKINGIVDRQAALAAWQDQSATIGPMVLHAVPAHRWAKELRSNAWARHDALLEPSFIHDAARRDALTSFARDVIQPLAADRAAKLGVDAHPEARRFIASLRINPARPMAERTAWIKAAGSAVLGGRGAKAYGEAAEKWHRRVASISALRLEYAAPSPGWPALCKPWTSSDGRATITAITTAEGLVEEGNRMKHCVGGYYSNCRTGHTHIFSYAVDGRPTATLELLVRAATGRLSVRRGQFEGLHRATPDETAMEHVQEMLAQIQSGRHKVDVALHAKFAEERAREYEYDNGSILPFEFVRKAWPLYLPLLARGTPDTFDAWVQTTPLVAAIDAELGRYAEARKTGLAA